MAQKKISELTSTSKLNDDNIIPLVQDGVTKHIRYGDMKSPIVKEVEANVEDYVDAKINTRVNYAFTSMLTLGFAKGSYVSVRDFWYKLANTFGNQGVIQFNYYVANAAYVGTSAKNAYLVGGTLIYTCSGAPAAWGWFTAIYCSAAGGTYQIRCTMSADTTAGKETWSITQLAHNIDVVSTQQDLANTANRTNLMYQYYPSTGKEIGKWHDGRSIMRVVYLAKDLTVTSAYANGGSVYGFTGGLTKQSDVDLFLSAKIHWKSGATLQDMDIVLTSLADYLFVVGGASSSLTTGNVDCLVVEFVEK